MLNTPIAALNCLTILCYNDNYSKSTGSITKFITTATPIQSAINWNIASSWREMIGELSEGCDFLVIHVDAMTEIHTTPTEFLDAITTVIRFLPNSRNIKIGVMVTPTTPLETIRALQSTEVQGILLDNNYYPIEDVRTSINALVNKIPYWPKTIIEASVDKDRRPLHVLFKSDAHTYISEGKQKIFDDRTGLKAIYCETWNELSSAIDMGARQMCIHIDILTHLELTITEIITMIDTRAKLTGISIAIMVGINRTTPHRFIKELKKTSALGISPTSTDWGIEETILATNALTNRQQYWPKHIIDELPNAKKTKNITTGIQLTTRQEQVFRMITERGASNKVIARALNLTESTVKLHVTEIFKKYGVKSRTQLAVFSAPIASSTSSK